MKIEAIAELAERGDFQAALVACERAEIDVATDGENAFFCGYCHYQLQNFDQALQFLETATSLAPGDSWSLLYLTLSNHALNRPVEALTHTIAYINLEKWSEAQPSPEEKSLVAFAVRSFSCLPASGQRAELAQVLLAGLKRTPDLFQIEQAVLAGLSKGAAFDAQAVYAALETFEAEPATCGQIVSVDEAVASGLGQYLHQSPPDPIHFARLTGETWADTKNFDLFEGYPNYAARLERVIVSGVSSAVFTTVGHVISDVYADAKYGHEIDLRGDKIIHYRIEQNVIFALPKTDRTIVRAINLSGLASNHFGHWCSEYIPRLRHFYNLPGFSDIPILINADMPPTHKEFLAAICDNAVIEVGRDETVFVETLYVAPTITFYPFDLRIGHTVPKEQQASWSASAFAFVRERVLAHLPKTDAKSDNKIYLSRQNSSWGRPLNEDEFLTEIVKRGLKPVFLEEMGFLEQVEVIRNAKVIVAPAGSALNMLMFAQPQAKILIYMQRFPHNWGGWAGPLQQINVSPVIVKMDQGSPNLKHVPFEMKTDALDRFLYGRLYAIVRKLASEFRERLVLFRSCLSFRK